MCISYDSIYLKLQEDNLNLYLERILVIVTTSQDYPNRDTENLLFFWPNRNILYLQCWLHDV